MTGNAKYISGLLGLLALGTVLSGCHIRPYDDPEFVDIKPNETAFLVPLESGNDQKQWFSEAFLKDKKVSARRVQIRHKWQQKGYSEGDGEYVKIDSLLVVDLSPVTREWTKSGDTGTSPKDQAFRAETKESNSFDMEVSASCHVSEQDAALFLHSFTGQPLEEVMDSQIRPIALTALTAAAGKLTVEQILQHKEQLNETMRSAVAAFCTKHGIVLDRIGIGSDITWVGKGVQEALDGLFKARAEKQAQVARNEASIEKAKADALVAHTMAGIKGHQFTDFTLRKMALENQAELIKVMKDKGIPQVVGQGTFLNQVFAQTEPGQTATPKPAPEPAPAPDSNQ